MVINPIVGVYIPIIRIPIKGGRSPIPKKRDNLDHGTYELLTAILDRTIPMAKKSLEPPGEVMYARGRDIMAGQPTPP